MPTYEVRKPQKLDAETLLVAIKKYFPDEQFTGMDLAKKLDVQVEAMSSGMGQLRKEELIELDGYIYRKDDKGNPRRISVWLLVK